MPAPGPDEEDAVGVDEDKLDGDPAAGSDGAGASDAASSADYERRTLLEGGSVPVEIEGQARKGRLRIIDMMDRQQMYAVCPIAEHGVCIKTRTCRPGRQRGQGRPAGFLAAWLKAGSSCATHAEHMKVALSFDDRRAARTELYLADRGADLLAYERPKLDGEDSEPEVIA